MFYYLGKKKKKKKSSDSPPIPPPIQNGKSKSKCKSQPPSGLIAHAQASAEKWAQKRQQYLDEEMSQCTFTPNLKKQNFNIRLKRKSERILIVDHTKELDERIDDALQDLISPNKGRVGAFETSLLAIEHFNTAVLSQIRSMDQSNIMEDLIVMNEGQMEVVECDNNNPEQDSKADYVMPPPPPTADVDKNFSDDVCCCICRGLASEDDEDDPDGDSSGGIIQLTSCQHHAHVICLKQQLQARWASKNISFNYLQCGECRTPLAHDMLSRYLAPHIQLKEDVERLCREQALVNDYAEHKEDFASKLAADYATATAECMATFSCYMCSVCSEPFCGGRVDCAQDDQIILSQMKCQSCAFNLQKGTTDAKTGQAKKEEAADVKFASSAWRGKCHMHGYKFAIYKCDSCCSVATWDCSSNHYCDRCHGQASSHKNYPCPGPKTCPLGIEHPPNKPGVHGTVDNGFIVGCSKCFLGRENDAMQFELATDASARGAVNNWKNRF